MKRFIGFVVRGLTNNSYHGAQVIIDGSKASWVKDVKYAHVFATVRDVLRASQLIGVRQGENGVGNAIRNDAWFPNVEVLRLFATDTADTKEEIRAVTEPLKDGETRYFIVMSYTGDRRVSGPYNTFSYALMMASEAAIEERHTDFMVRALVRTTTTRTVLSTEAL